MGIWSEIKYALNDTLAKQGFLPLNKIVEKENYENSINTISFVNSILGNDDNSFYAVDYGTEKIKESEFSENSILESVLMPNTIRKIEKYGFKNCEALKKINIPESVEEIGQEAFWNCSSLEKIILPEKTKKIYESAFRDCTSLKNISFPNTIEYIGKNVVQGCTRLSEITIPMIGDSTGSQFFGSIFAAPNHQRQREYVPESLEKVTLLEGVESIPDNAFWGLYIKNVVFPDSLKSIGNSAFSNCNSIDFIKLPNKLEVLKTGAFANCSGLTSIILGSSSFDSSELVLEGNRHFYNCKMLSSITLLNNVKKIPSDTFGDCSAVSFIQILNPDIEIETGAFGESLSIEVISYYGTTSKWNSRKLSSKFITNGKTTVKCSDGNITI